MRRRPSAAATRAILGARHRHTKARTRLGVRGAAPQVRMERRARGQVQRAAQREEDGEPGEHAGRVRRRVRAEPHVAVQLRAPASALW